MDWLRLTRSKPTPLRRRDITLAEVKQHNKPDDAWMVFQSKVWCSAACAGCWMQMVVKEVLLKRWGVCRAHCCGIF
jgi:hypothetical protein